MKNSFVYMTGMNAVSILVLFFTFTLIAPGQEQKGAQVQDTTAIMQRSVDSKPFFINPEFLPSRSREFNPAYFRGNFTLPLDISSQYIPWSTEDKIDLISPWKLQMADQKDYRLFGTIIGAMELGGAMYIAYKHVKKYGLK